MRPVPKQPLLWKLPMDDGNLSRDRARQPALMGPRVGAGSCLNGVWRPCLPLRKRLLPAPTSGKYLFARTAAKPAFRKAESRWVLPTGGRPVSGSARPVPAAPRVPIHSEPGFLRTQPCAETQPGVWQGLRRERPPPWCRGRCWASARGPC